MKDCTKYRKNDFDFLIPIECSKSFSRIMIKNALKIMIKNVFQNFIGMFLSFFVARGFAVVCKEVSDEFRGFGIIL